MYGKWKEYSFSGKFVLQVVAFILIGSIIGLPLSWPTNSLSYNGIGADSDGRVYIGEELWIGVYEDRELVDKIVRNNRGSFYEFTIINDQIHVWDTSDYHKVLDLEGNEVDRWYEFHSGGVLELQEKREFTAKDGCFYELENGLLKRAKVVCYFPDGNEEVVFQMPLGLYLTKLAFFAYLAALVLWLSRLGFCYMKKYWHPERHDK